LDIRNRPLFTDTYDSVESFEPQIGSAYIYGASPEERSSHIEKWKNKIGQINFVQIIDQNIHSIKISIDKSEKAISLRSNEQLTRFFNELSEDLIYIDITGLSHHVWAPLLKFALRICNSVIAIYVEPGHYSFSSTLKEGEIFDLSEKISGIAPIPGFISLKEPLDEENICFVPLLGFEGTRFLYLLEQVEPIGERILPIIGVPGFRPEYPFFAYHANKFPLKQTQSWKNIRYSTANCPFSLFYTLENIFEDYPGCFLKIAPIGTKPHALGAILFKILNNDRVEIVYDHPMRKPTRTEGTARLLAYHLSAFSQGSQNK